LNKEVRCRKKHAKLRLWQEYLGILCKKNEEEKIETTGYSIKKGRLFVNDSWIKKIAEKLGLISTLKQGGRLKKYA